MRWFRDLSRILAEEPESWIGYLRGQQIENLPQLTRKKPRYRGLTLQVLKYVATVFRDFRPLPNLNIDHATSYYIFAGTSNQMGSVDRTIDALRANGESVCAVGFRRFINGAQRNGRYSPFSLGVLDVFRTFAIFCVRGPGLYRSLKGVHPVSVNWHFAEFCAAYTYLPYFYRTLSRIRPNFVITANDHNVPNRCLLAAAHFLGITTVYLQHASVSTVFPALRVNYAFLDGQSALDIYRKCESNQPSDRGSGPLPVVLLSGQKKVVRSRSADGASAVGVALNALDNVQAGISLVKGLSDRGLKIHIRWHPSQDPRDIAEYRSAFKTNSDITLSDPRRESIADFLGQIRWLVAANSSIHLEAALANVIPIYHELTPADHPDYYGYVKHGLAQKADSVDELVETISKTRANPVPNVDAVRYYSATYLTEWDGKEGELVADSLIRLSKGESPDSLFGFSPFRIDSISSETDAKTVFQARQ